MEWKVDPNFPWVVTDLAGRSMCPVVSINPGHWKRNKKTRLARSHGMTIELCRCHDVAIFDFDWDESQEGQ